MNLLRISKAKDHPRVPFTRAILYKFHHCGRFPTLFVKFGGGLFIDLDELERLLEAGRGNVRRRGSRK